MEALALELARRGVLKSNLVRSAFLRMDRRFFCIPGDPNCYEDHPVGIGYGQTLSAPHMHVEALNALSARLSAFDTKRPVAVLDVGSGSGILVGAFAVLLRDMGFTGRVVGVELVAELASRSRNSLRAAGLGDLLDDGSISVYEGSAYDFAFDQVDLNNIDFVHVGAAAESLPGNLVDCLAPGGVMLLPIGPHGGIQRMCLVEKSSGDDGGITIDAGLDVRYVPLVE